MIRRKCILRSALFLLAATLLLVLLIAFFSACGNDSSSDGSPPTTDGPLDTQTTGAPQGVVIDEATSAEMDLAEFDGLVTDASDRLIQRHGGDLPAFCAVLLALDRGYDAYQLLAGALNDRLEADGRILVADGSVLTPARPAEVFIEAANRMAEPVVLACLSGPVFLAETIDPASAHIFENLRTLSDLYDHFKPVRDRYEEIARQEARDAYFTETTTRVATILSARGYSAQQIIEAIVLDGVTPEDLENSNSWVIIHPSGVTLGPDYEAVKLAEGEGFPPIDRDAPTDHDPGDIEAALAGGDGGATSAGDDEESALSGTYVGKPGLPPMQQSIPADFSVDENTITVTVEKDGTLRGYRALVYSYTAGEADAPVYCTGEWRETLDGALADSAGTATGTLAYRFVSEGGESPQDQRATLQTTYAIQVTGSTMIMTLNAQAVDTEGDVDFLSCELTRQAASQGSQ